MGNIYVAREVKQMIDAEAERLEAILGYEPSPGEVVQQVIIELRQLRHTQAKFLSNTEPEQKPKRRTTTGPKWK